MGEEPTPARLHPGNRYMLAPDGETIGKADWPAAFAIVHGENDDRFARRIIDRLVEEQEIRSHLRNGKRRAIHQQLHRHATGAPAMSKGSEHG